MQPSHSTLILGSTLGSIPIFPPHALIEFDVPALGSLINLGWKCPDLLWAVSCSTHASAPAQDMMLLRKGELLSRG